MKHLKSQSVERVFLPQTSSSNLPFEGQAAVPHAWRVVYATARAMAEQRLRDRWHAQYRLSSN